jgi:signal transduction histidine kinase/PAS domain-containing protein
VVIAGRQMYPGFVTEEAANQQVRSGSSHEPERTLLRDMASSLPLAQILEHLVRIVESRAPGLMGSVLLLEGGRLKVGAAPSLPEGYSRAADDHPVGEGFGSCGTAAHRGQLVVVEDIQTDPLWKNYREIARRYGLGACWSMPIIGSDTRVLGTFTLYYSRPRRPRPDELELIRDFSSLAALAVEYHRTRQALREGQREFIDLVDDLEALVWEGDGQDRRFVHVSTRAQARLGHPAQRFTEPGFWASLLHPEDRQAILSRPGGDSECEYRLVTAQGEPVWVRDIAYDRGDRATGERRRRGIMINISRQRQAEDERETLFRRLLDERREPAPAPPRVDPTEGALMLLADAGAALGRSLEPETTARNVAALATRGLADWCLVLARDDNRLRCLALGHADPAQHALAQEFDRLLPQPGGCPFRVSAVMASGQAELIADVTVDSFEPGAVRADLMRLARDLGAVAVMTVPLMVHSAVLGAIVYVSAGPGRRYDAYDLLVASELGRRAALALENARLYHQAQAAIRQREEFLSIAAHELNTPLASMQLTVQSMLAALEHGPVDLDFLRGRALAGERHGHRLGRLIRDLLDVSRIQAGRMQLCPEEMDLVEAVHLVLGRLQEDLTRRGVDVAVHAPGPVRGCWDPNRIEQVITNLVTNAIKYGEGRPVQINVNTDEDAVRLSVRDSGIGMRDELLKRLFTPFERGVLPGHYGGLGLGLYITSQIVQAHQGRIDIASSPGAGSTFTVGLPRRATAA